MGNEKKPTPPPKKPGTQTPSGSKTGAGNNKPAGSTTQRPPQR